LQKNARALQVLLFDASSGDGFTIRENPRQGGFRITKFAQTMANRNDNNYISVWYWMFMLLITAIPIIGFIMVLVWAFTGDNESRKNYFRAILAWILIFVVFAVALVFLGSLPVLQKQIQTWMHKA
jgi:cellulose synthase/poly-beta-1,6-N-acetylglucosamine synthase-like glycosyltransferase